MRMKSTLTQIGRLVFLLLIISSCTTDFDLYHEHSPVPVVYCQFDPTDDYCYLTLSKSFQSAGNARDQLRRRNELMLNDAQITLQGWSEGYKAWETGFVLIDTKDLDTSASVCSRSIYRSAKKMKLNTWYLESRFSDWLYEDFRLIVRSPEFDEPAYSRIPVIHPPILMYPRSSMDFNLYGDEDSYFEFKMDQSGAEYADFICDFYYQEYTNYWANRKVRFVVNKNLSLAEDPVIRLYYDSFFNKLVKAIGDNPDIQVRRFKYMDFTFSVSDEYFNDYYSVSSSGYASDYTYYSNVSDGMGLFSMKRKITITEIKFDKMTLDSLQKSELTRHLNFINY
jgi:hypothetical protein